MADGLQGRVCATGIIVSVGLMLVGSADRLAADRAPATGSIGGRVEVVTKSSRRLISTGAYPGSDREPRRDDRHV